MLQTSVTCAAGMAVFAFSDFLPTARFAWMMMALFAAAIVGDLILLPAMLIGPLGRLFADHSPGQEASSLRHATNTACPRPAFNQRSSAASIVSPGPKPSTTHGAGAWIIPRRSSTKAIVGDDILP